MDTELIKRIDILGEKVQQLLPSLQLGQKQQQVLEMEESMQAADFWSDPQRAQAVSQNYNVLKEYVGFWNKFGQQLAELKTLVDQNTDESEETLTYLKQSVARAEKEFSQNRLIALLSKQYDDHGAVLAIHAGAGGTDAQDFAEMLFRMYTRYAGAKKFKIEILEQSRGSEAGIKSVLLQIDGPYAYGYLKAEAGVHRLVRLSPFNPAHTRETSFALVEVLPALGESETVSLDPKDLKIEANTASGHGGQSVNTTYSAIRITHIPTGIVVSCQEERSQHKNRAKAMAWLAAKLESQQRDAQHLATTTMRRDLVGSGDRSERIRTYNFSQGRVTDHRINLTLYRLDAIMEGDLTELLSALAREHQADQLASLATDDN